MARPQLIPTSLVALVCLWLPSTVVAQQASGIAGVVKDSAGMPVAGVTVEAASPALIERVRTVVTDGQGAYQVTSLPPGTYSVTFKAAGFSTLKNDGIELPAGFTASVNGSLRPGNPTEVVTVTSTTTQVDTRGAAVQTTVSGEQAQERASGTGGAQQATSVVAALVNPTVDVGGAAGPYASTGNRMTVRGKVHVRRLFDGMAITNMETTVGGSTSYMTNTAAVDQTVVQLGSGAAENDNAAGFINYVPKAGSNTYQFRLSGLVSKEGMQADNLDDTLRARGLTAVQKVGNIWDVTATAGGPVMKDKLWFYFAPKAWGIRNWSAGVYWDDTQGSPFYTPANGTGIDIFGIQRAPAGLPIRRGDQFEVQNSYPVRLTWQATAKDKFNFFEDFPATGCTCRGLPTTTSPEASGSYIWGRKNHLWQLGLFQASWTETRTSKLLLEGGWSFAWGGFPGVLHPTVTPDDISITDLGLGFTYNDTAGIHSGLATVPVNVSDRMVERFSTSYVTGSHAIKVGMQLEHGWHETYNYVNHNMTYQFRNGVPIQITEYSTPYTDLARLKVDLGVYAQDRWTIKRLTLNYGLRFSYFNAGIPAQHADPVQFVSFPRDFAAVDCVPCWKDLDPRVGGSYDLFGNGKTAIKGAFGRYVIPQVLTIARANNPFTTSVNSITRTWNSSLATSPLLRGDYIPLCDLTNPNANGECGPISNALFGFTNPNATRYADDVIQQNRDYIIDSSIEVQHQVTPTLTVGGGYYRNRYGNLYTTQNVLTTPSDYNPFCVTVPVDPRLPGGGGNQLCGLYDVTPTKFGQVQNLVRQSSDLGTQTFVNNYLGFNFNARLPRGIRWAGSIDAGRTVSDKCFVIDSPMQQTYLTDFLHQSSTVLGIGTPSAANPSYCHEVLPFSGTLQIRTNGTYPLPYGFAVSANYQNTTGPMDLAVWNAPNSVIAPSVGRNLAACGTRVTCTSTFAVPLIQPGTVYESRLNQLDLRFNKILRLSQKVLLTGNLGVYNVLNHNNPISIQTTYGGQWLKPTRVMDGRLLQVAARLDF
jgi:hypothetical protein